MPTVLFQVQSTRVHDMNLDEGSCLGRFQEMLKANGYDVQDAKIRVHRPDGILIGKLAQYKLQQGDYVTFNTESVEFPASVKAMKTEAYNKACDEYLNSLRQAEQVKRPYRYGAVSVEKHTAPHGTGRITITFA